LAADVRVVEAMLLAVSSIRSLFSAVMPDRMEVLLVIASSNAA
jgi:hypothetical protein